MLPSPMTSLPVVQLGILGQLAPKLRNPSQKDPSNPSPASSAPAMRNLGGGEHFTIHADSEMKLSQ